MADDPEGRYKAYETAYEDYDNMWSAVQKEGTFRPWWEYMLSGKGDEMYGEGSYNGNTMDPSKALAKLGFSMGENSDDVELDVKKGMTTNDYIKGIMDATGMDEGAASAFFSELVGHS